MLWSFDAELHKRGLLNGAFLRKNEGDISWLSAPIS